MMSIVVNTYSTKMLSLWGLLAIPSAFILSIGLALLSGYEQLFYLFIPLSVLSVYFGFRSSKTQTLIDLSDGRFLKINEEKIPYQEITGYFINDMGLLQSALSLRLKSKRSIHLVSLNYGSNGEKFRKVCYEIIPHLLENIPELKVLEYQDVHTKQASILRPLLIILAGVVILIDCVVIVMLFVWDDFYIPPRIFLVNFALVALFPFIRKRKVS